MIRLETTHLLIREPKQTDLPNWQLVGSIGYTVTANTPAGKVVGAGYFILPEYQGKGYVSEALREIMWFAFEVNDVYRFETGCLMENISSERVMKKCDLIREGYFKDYEWHEGKFKDRVKYRMLKSEWETQRLSDTQALYTQLIL